MMKSVTFLLVASLVLLVPSCTSSPPDDPPEGSGREWKSELPRSEELAGREVVASSDGPWEVRSTGGADGRGGGRTPGVRGGMKSESAPAPVMDAAGFSGDADGAEMAAEPDAPAGPGGAGGATKGAPLGEALPERMDEALSVEERPAPSTPAPESEARDSSASPLAGAEAAPPMRASVTDDNENYNQFLEFIAGWSDRSDVAQRIDYLDVSDRKHLRVVNAAGDPVPGARVLLVDEVADRILQAGTTYGDGRVPYYPHVPPQGASEGPTASAGERSLLVEVTFRGERKLERWDGAGDEFVVVIDAPDPVGEPIALDVLFLIDTTGSMGDEIQRIKATLLQVTQKLRRIEREFELRYAAVLYRDLGDEYVTKSHPFTADIEAFDKALRSVAANGGGDGPESLNQGLAEAVGRNDWREGAARLIFLIADAPPHMDYEGDVRYPASLRAAVERGIRVHSVAASGLDATGSFVFRQIAQYTRGKFIFIEYGTPEESAASHGVAGTTKSNNLDDIIFEQIKEEVATWGRA